MTTIAQSEVSENLSEAIARAASDTVIIRRDGQSVAALISMDRLQELKQLDMLRMQEIAQEAEPRVAEHAAELGITPEELVERLLADEK